nr:sulfurtransferase TusA family protein [Enterococcus crotali]
MKKISALGKPCPIPVIEAKKAIRELTEVGGTVEIIVDNEVSVNNVQKMAVGLGLKTNMHQLRSDQFAVMIDVPKEWEKTDINAGNNQLVIAFGQKRWELVILN